MIEASEEFGIEEIRNLANKIYDTGVIPRQMREFRCGKKRDLALCNYRCISLMSYITKIILRVIVTRGRSKISPEIGEEQFGFWKEKSTRHGFL